MKITTPFHSVCSLCVAGAAALAISTPAIATPTTYNISSASATWESDVWTPSDGDATSLFPDRAGDIANNTLGALSTLTLDITGGGFVTVGRISKSSGSSASWTINPGSGGTAASLILDNTGGTGNASIYTSSGSSQMVVNADIQIANTDLDVKTNAGASTTIGGAITAAAGQTRTLNLINGDGAISISGSVGVSGGNIGIDHSGNGTGSSTLSGNLGSGVQSVIQGSSTSGLTLSGDNSAFAGSVTINAGSVTVGSTTAFNAANVVSLNGGKLQIGVNVTNGAFDTTVAGLNGASGDVTNNGKTTQTLTLGGSGTYSYDGTLNTSSQNATHAARFKLAVALTGSGTQTLTGDSYFTGGTTVTSGTLLANNSTGSALGTGAVAVNGGTLGGTGFIGGASTVTGGNLAAGTAGTAGTLTFNSTLNLSGLSGTGQLKFDLGATGFSDKVALGSGALSIGSVALNFDDFSFTALSGFDGGIYTLFDTSTSIIGSLGSSLTGTVNGLTATLSLSGDGQDVLLTVVSAIPEPSAYAVIAGAVILAGAFVRRRRS